jgi:hypothetical protein
VSSAGGAASPARLGYSPDPKNKSSQSPKMRRAAAKHDGANDESEEHAEKEIGFA